MVDGMVIVDNKVGYPWYMENIPIPITLNPLISTMRLRDVHERNADCPIRYK